MNLKKTILLVFFITNFSNAQDSFPKFREIVNKLFQNYEVSEFYQENDLLLEKRNSGWFVKMSNTKDTLQQLFWDKHTNEYKKIKLPLKSVSKEITEYNEYINKEENEIKVKNQILKTYPELHYQIFPYFGYDGCFYDNIKLLEKKSELNDNEIYTLGYSYSQVATNLINDNFDFTLKNLKYNLPYTNNSMNTNQLEKFIQYSVKALGYYKTLIEKSPNYYTIPGSIKIKYSNEMVSLYLNLLVYQNEEIASKYIFQNELYSENINQYSKLMLDSCEPNAILFTAGDNDTFPLLYYQLKNNHRKDILIINTSLLNDSRYIIMLKNGIFHNNKITYSLDEEYIKNKKSRFIILETDSNFINDITKLNKIIFEKNIELNTGEEINLISNNFRFGADKNSLNWIYENDVLSRNQLILLDIIGQNKWKRPVYFTDYNSDNEYLGLSNYLQFEGFIYKLSKDFDENTDNVGYIKNPEIIENLLSKINFKNINNLPVEEKQLVEYIRNLYLRLSKFYYEKNSKEKAILTLDKCLNTYNNTTCPYNYFTIEFIDLYKSLNEKSKSDNIKNEVLKNIENKNHIYYYQTDEYINEKLSSHKKYIENTYN